MFFVEGKTTKYSGFHAFLETADKSAKGPQGSLITFIILLRNI